MQQRQSDKVSTLCSILTECSGLKSSLLDELAMTSSSQAVLASSEFVDKLLEQLKLRPMPKTRLQNSVFHLLRNNSLNSKFVLSDSFVKEVQFGWRRRLIKSLCSLASELNLALAKPRETDDHEDWRTKWNELSTLNVVTDAKALVLVKPVYAPKDLLDLIIDQMVEPNLIDNGLQIVNSEAVLGLIRLPFPHCGLNFLKSSFESLQIHLGLQSKSSEMSEYELERFQLGIKVIQRGLAPVAQEYLKLGCPHSLRGRIWSMVLVEPHTRNREEEMDTNNLLEVLRACVLNSELLMDRVLIKDVKVAAANDDNYFVFEDTLLQLMLLFFRDTTIPSNLDSSLINNVIVANLRSTSTDDNASATVYYPPNGLVPFHGFSLYAAPFCYVYSDLQPMYNAFRAFYCRYAAHLHHVSMHRHGIVRLSHLFETLLQENERALWLHLRSHNIQPLRTAFRWLMRGFAGHLPPEPLLFLWDLVLAHDSLDVLAVLAAAIFSFRKNNLLQVGTQQGVEGVMADLNSVPIMHILALAMQQRETRAK